LHDCGIEHREKTYQDNASSFNFTRPNCFDDWKVKGLDRKLLGCSKNQFGAILEAYLYSDGSKTSGNGLLIYSAKEQEIDLLQEIAVVNGYGATKYSRYHGFKENEQYQLSVTPSKFHEIRNIKNRTVVENVENEMFWCIKTRNQNFIMRRRGRVHLTGNSHGRMSDFGKSCDVGVDCWNYTPLSFERLRVKMEKAEYKPFGDENMPASEADRLKQIALENKNANTN
jgi:hypothetical protein